MDTRPDGTAPARDAGSQALAPPPRRPARDPVPAAIACTDAAWAIIPVPRRRRLKPWLATLASARIPYEAQEGPDGWEIVVPADVVAEARRELGEYERANRGWPPRTAFLGDVADAYPRAGEAGLWVALALLAFYLLVGEFDRASPDVLRGSADAEAIVRGEWWRCLTALTLHADIGHVLGNALCLWWYGRFLSRSLGAGVGWLAVAGAGLLGNLAAAHWHGAAHDAVGASTASFGALGILTVLQFRRTFTGWRDLASVWSRSWLPLLAGVAILTYLGFSPGSDIAGHVFGFLAGLAVGGCLLPVADRRLPLAAQFLAGGGAVTALLAAWTLVMRGGGA